MIRKTSSRVPSGTLQGLVRCRATSVAKNLHISFTVHTMPGAQMSGAIYDARLGNGTGSRNQLVAVLVQELKR